MLKYNKESECFLCKSDYVFDKFKNGYICKECYVKWICRIAVNQWEKSINHYYEYEENVDKVISMMLNDIKFKNSSKKHQDLLLEEIKNMIYSRLQYYNKDELYIAMLTIRDNIRRLLFENDINYDWKLISDITTTTTLMSIIMNIADDKYKNNSLEKLELDASNLITAICMARRYNTIITNLELMKDKDISLNEICFNPIETEKTNKYFIQYLKNGINEKPEDYIIKNTALKDKLESEGKTPDYILESLNEVIVKEFGFERNDYQRIIKHCVKMESPIIIMKKNIMEQLCGKERLESILNIFSINRNINSCEFDKGLELLSFYEKDDYIIFAIMDFIQNISIFEKFILSNDYIDVLKKNISNNILLTKTQKKMSQYLSISIADYLYSRGYKLPIEKYKNVTIPRAEIDKIKVNGKQLLATCGDIDVLALDTVKKIVILFEIKYYKPAISTTDMLYKDKSRINKDEVMRKMKKREEIVSENIDEIVKYVLGKYEYGYKIKSILLTPRANYYAINEEKLNYLTWAEFIEKADNNQL